MFILSTFELISLKYSDILIIFSNCFKIFLHNYYLILNFNFIPPEYTLCAKTKVLFFRLIQYFFGGSIFVEEKHFEDIMKKKIGIVLLVIVALIAFRWINGKFGEFMRAKMMGAMMTPKVKLSQAEEIEYKNEIEEKNQKIPEIIGISAKNRQGIQTLEETLKNMFFEGNLSFNDEIYITNVRQKAALQDAKEALLQVLESIRNGMPEDFYSIDLMAAYEALGSITGETIGEDLVNEIFSKFCMGK